MWSSYKTLVTELMPNAQVVADRFHVMTQINTEKLIISIYLPFDTGKIILLSPIIKVYFQYLQTQTNEELSWIILLPTTMIKDSWLTFNFCHQRQ
ncbi:transposase [Okeanomitos corallinicola]|uniref:transposase n=1 Tax=Okeanomitos corallinicola TaxID=3231550 RepID=UPI00338F6696